jgi:2-C-methyl-D-erythritol 2,4-cyclodiphosphate synthase
VRTGIGFDVHAFEAGRKLVLCGVNIPGDTGLAGHSDADVAIHALIDAILGSLAWGDIGVWFPDSDDSYKGADSLELLREVWRAVSASGWELGNLDITIAAQQPKISPHTEMMKSKLSGVFQCPGTSVSVKATTTERLGFVGRSEGIAAMAVVLLEGGDAARLERP